MTDTATALPLPISRTYISQGLRLHYVDWGNANAPPLILLHGGRDHCRSWDWVARRLSPKWHVIAPDLRGHGDSEWTRGGSYMMPGHIYDLAQLIHQQKLAPVTIIAHSLGGSIALRYTGLYPETVARIVAIEGLGARMLADRQTWSIHKRMTTWIDDNRALAPYPPRRYPTLDDAIARMREANTRLSAEQARHLTLHAVNQNEDGTYSWKFDPYAAPWSPYDMTPADVRTLWGSVTCPTLLMWGHESWHTDPAADGRATVFQHAEVVGFEGAGHWIHHDKLEPFMATVERFLG